MTSSIYSTSTGTPITGSRDYSTERVFAQNSSYYSSDYSPHSYNSSLYTQEERKLIKKQKARLELEISTLKKRKSALKKEKDRLKKNIVPEGEVTVLKAETREHFSELNSNELNTIMNEFAKELKELYAAKTMCTVFEQLAANEEKQRNYIIEESNAITRTFEFEEYPINIPSIKKYGDRNQFIAHDDINRLKAQLEALQTEIRRIDRQSLELSDSEHDAAVVVANCAQAQWTHNSMALHIIKADVQHLQRYAKELETTVRKLENEVECENRKLSSIAIENVQNDSKIDSQLGSLKVSSEQQEQHMEQEIEGIKQKIDEAANYYDDIINELSQLQEVKLQLVQYSEEDEMAQEYPEMTEQFGLIIDEEEDEVMPDFTDLQEPKKPQNSAMQELEARLLKQKESLITDINNLENETKKVKSLAKLEESRAKTNIKRLYVKYVNLKKQIKKSQLDMNSSSSSNIQNDISNVLTDLDRSINELKSEFS